MTTFKRNPPIEIGFGVKTNAQRLAEYVMRRTLFELNVQNNKQLHFPTPIVRA